MMLLSRILALKMFICQGLNLSLLIAYCFIDLPLYATTQINLKEQVSNPFIITNYLLTLKPAVFLEENSPHIACLFEESPAQKYLLNHSFLTLPFPLKKGHSYLRSEEVSNFLNQNHKTNIDHSIHYVVQGKGSYLYYNQPQEKKSTYTHKVDDWNINVIKLDGLNKRKNIFLETKKNYDLLSTEENLAQRIVNQKRSVFYIVPKKYAKQHYLRRNTPVTIIYKKGGIYIQGKGTLINYVKNNPQETKLLKIKLLYSKKILTEHIIIGNHLIFR